MENVRLSEHFSLAEMTRTNVKGLQNVPGAQERENLRRLCQEWLEELRYTYNTTYVLKPGADYMASPDTEPIVINSGFRSPEVNRAVGGAQASNHLTGCAADIRCADPAHALRYATLLLDISEATKRAFDELIIERRGTTFWIHFAVRPTGNRGRVLTIEH